MKRFTEVSNIDTCMLREFCCQHEFYTRGDVRAYSNMFDMARQYDGTPGALSMIALDIVAHSDENVLLDYTESGDRDEMVLDMMNMISEHCITRWYAEVD